MDRDRSERLWMPLGFLDLDNNPEVGFRTISITSEKKIKEEIKDYCFPYFKEILEDKS